MKKKMGFILLFLCRLMFLKAQTIPDSFTFQIKINFLDVHHILAISCVKTLNDTIPQMSMSGSDKYFSEDFYETLIEDINNLNGFASFQTLYEDSKNENFVMYRRFKAIGYPRKTILVNDIDNNGNPDILLANKSESGMKNPVYELYCWNKEKRKFVLVVDFFKGAFYGWDKNGYLITGWAEGTQFSKIKNVVKGLRLIPIEKSTYHGDKLISRKKLKR